MDDKLVAALTEKLSKLDDTPETRRKALILKQHLMDDENARTRIKDIEEGIFSDVFTDEDCQLGNRLFELIKREYQLESAKDLMDLNLMVINYLKARRLHRVDVTEDAKLMSMYAAVIQRFTNNYSKLGNDLAINRQQRLVRKIEKIDESGSITQMFSSIQQYEKDHPEVAEVYIITDKDAKTEAKVGSSKSR